MAPKESQTNVFQVFDTSDFQVYYMVYLVKPLFENMLLIDYDIGVYPIREPEGFHRAERCQWRTWWRSFNDLRFAI